MAEEKTLSASETPLADDVCDEYDYHSAEVIGRIQDLERALLDEHYGEAPLEWSEP